VNELHGNGSGDRKTPLVNNGGREARQPICEMQAKRIEVWLTFISKAFWPALLIAVFLLFNTEIKRLFERLTSLDLAGQKFTFSERLKEPVLNIVSLSDIADTTIDIRKDTLKQDAFFQVCKKFVVLRTSEIPDNKNAQAKQLFQIIEVIRASIICGEFTGLIVLDEKDRYVGSFDRSFFLETVIPWTNLVNYPAGKPPAEVASWLKSRSIFGLALEHPKARIDSGEGFRISIQLNQSVAEAMETLIGSGKDFVAVVDGQGRFQGTISRADLLDRLLLALVPKRQ